MQRDPFFACAGLWGYQSVDMAEPASDVKDFDSNLHCLELNLALTAF